MNWQYRTILFEFQKDGLLGDRYIDADEMEQVLNEQGKKSWELVSVTPVQEGLLSFLKRELQQKRKQVSVRPGEPADKNIKEKKSSERPGIQLPLTPPKGTQPPGKSQVKKPVQKPGGVGGIKIS